MRVLPLPAVVLAALLPWTPPALPTPGPGGREKSPGPKTPRPRQMEHLGRGLVAVNQGRGTVYVGWRLLGTDPDDVAFDLYRATGGGRPVRLNRGPITGATNFVDAGADLRRPTSYFVRPVLHGRGLEPSAPFTLPANPPARQYLS